jgi:hypothetical protein
MPGKYSRFMATTKAAQNKTPNAVAAASFHLDRMGEMLLSKRKLDD